MTVPTAAVTAAMNAIHAENAKVWGEAAATSEAEGGETEAFAEAILKAAAPHIAAAERERIRQLAIRTGAACTGDEGTSHYFADLLTEGEPDGS